MMPACSTPSTYETSKRDYAVESRSTSAGSNESDQPYRQISGRALPSLKSVLPEYEYPVPVVIRNTFIDTQVGRTLSLDDFFEERRIHSCPVEVPRDFDDESPTQPQPLHRAITTGAQALLTTVATAAGFWTAPEYGTAAAPIENANFLQPMRCVLMLSEALPEPTLGSAELPTAGSVGHNLGNCKPCAFFHARGCENGVQCVFCHLCPADEKRRRQKGKQAVFREMRQQRRQVRL